MSRKSKPRLVFGILKGGLKWVSGMLKYHWKK